ncbi:hypothetical protein BHM03_00057563 [Ensete ventricosum]|nr:hypothetical protein BHM03_00057563 [Ensete ventricosum]
MMGQDQAWTSGRGSDDVVGHRQEFARRFTKGIGKLARNMQGDHRKNTKKLIAKIPEAVVLAGGLVFTQKRLVLDAGVPQEVGLGSGHRSVGVEPL